MPTYEYRCKSCGKTHEIEHGFHDKRPTKCPSCGGELVRVFHPIGLVFKGSGFHKTDYAGTSRRAKSGDASDAKPSETKPASDSKAAESKADSAPKADKKPEKKSDPKSSGTSSST